MQAQPHQESPGKNLDTARTRYRMRQNLFALGDDFWIENEQGEQVYEVDGKALRLRKTLIFKDAHGKELCQIKEHLVSIRKKMGIEGPDGHPIASVTKAMITLLREHYTLHIEGAPDVGIQGNLLDHEYEFTQNGRTVAAASKKWFRVADSYGVEIERDQNHVLILAATVAVDLIAHPAR